MRRIKDNLDISHLLIKYLKEELSNEERVKVEKLLDEESHLEEIVKNIQDKEYLERKLKMHSRINLDEKWLVQKNKIRKYSFKKQLYQFSRIAAAILFPALIAAYLLFTYEKPYNDSKTEFVSKVIPESSKVQLVDEKGDVHEFARDEANRVLEKLESVELKSGAIVYNQKVAASKLALKEKVHTLIVPHGEEYELNLSDGSKIWINAESKLKYPKQFLGKNRVVELVEGEAYFEVAHDAAHPFIVKTEKSLVKVLGTSFNIRAYNDELYNETTLVEGSVSLRHKYDEQSEIQLKPGEQALLIDVNRRIKVNTIDTYPYLAWREGYYVFESISLKSIFEQLSRWYDFEVEFASDVVREMKFRGNVDRKSGILEILNLLEKTERVGFEYRGKNIRVKEH